jgi:hypothetical protein
MMIVFGGTAVTKTLFAARAGSHRGCQRLKSVPRVACERDFGAFADTCCHCVRKKARGSAF